LTSDRGSTAPRSAVAARVDDALRESGFLLVTGHGVPDELRRSARGHARRFFALPDQHAAVSSLAPPVGVRAYPPVIAHEYPLEKISSITVG
jgi:isopenicillin N synthase-like dioxygenase